MRGRGVGERLGDWRGARLGLEVGTGREEGLGVEEDVTRRRVSVVREREDGAVRCSGRGVGVTKAMVIEMGLERISVKGVCVEEGRASEFRQGSGRCKRRTVDGGEGYIEV